MSTVRTFFRHCPGCGRRFEIRLVSKTQVSERTIVEEMPVQEYSAPMSAIRSPVTPLTETVPAIVDEKEFQYRYRCSHCGHQWSEERVTDSQVKAQGYKGD